MPGNRGDAVRGLHRAAVLAEIRRRRAVTRADLVRSTGLSRATVSRIVVDLVADGAVAVTGAGIDAGQNGRPAQVLVPAPPPGVALSVDVGHEHVRVLLGNGVGTVLHERVQRFGARRPVARSLSAVPALVQDVLAAAGVPRRELAGVAVGLPQPVDLSGRTADRRRGVAEVSAATGLEVYADRVLVRNDAHLGAVGEAAYGAGRRFAGFIYVTVSSGIGAGLVLTGKLYRGEGFAGDLGHVPVVEGGDICHCGNRGCLETVASVDRLVRSLQPAHPDRKLTVADLVQLCRDGDPGARRLVADAAGFIGRTLADVVATLSPAAIVVGGQLAEVGEPLLRGIDEAVHRYTSALTARDLVVVGSGCGERAAALGGVALSLGVVGEHGGVPPVDPVDPGPGLR